MYSLTVCFGPVGTTWAFMFKDKEKAHEAHLKAKGWNAEFPYFEFTDDFGQYGAFRHDEVRGILLEDLDLTDEAKIVRSLANARNEVKARQRASTDPVIRSGMQQQGPSVLTPFRQN